MAGGVVLQGGPARQTPADRDAADALYRKSTNDRGVSNFLSAARGGANFDTSYTDTETGQNYAYKGRPKTSFNDQMNDFSNLMGRFNTSGSATPLSGSGGLQPRVQLDHAAIDAGDSAAFSKAKDKVGGSTQGLMKALQNQFSARGLRGSSIEGRQIGSGLEAGAGQLGDVARDQAVEGSRRAVDLAKTEYGGEIQQRGQDLDAETAMRAYELQGQQSKTSTMIGLINAFNGMKY